LAFEQMILSEKFVRPKLHFSSPFCEWEQKNNDIKKKYGLKEYCMGKREKRIG